jgi:hypothetical protein
VQSISWLIEEAIFSFLLLYLLVWKGPLAIWISTDTSQISCIPCRTCTDRTPTLMITLNYVNFSNYYRCRRVSVRVCASYSYHITISIQIILILIGYTQKPHLPIFIFYNLNPVSQKNKNKQLNIRHDRHRSKYWRNYKPQLILLNIGRASSQLT